MPRTRGVDVPESRAPEPTDVQKVGRARLVNIKRAYRVDLSCCIRNDQALNHAAARRRPPPAAARRPPPAALRPSPSTVRPPPSALRRPPSAVYPPSALRPPPGAAARRPLNEGRVRDATQEDQAHMRAFRRGDKVGGRLVVSSIRGRLLTRGEQMRESVSLLPCLVRSPSRRCRVLAIATSV